MMGDLVDMKDARNRIRALQATMEATFFPEKRGTVTQWKLARLLPRKQVPVEQEAAIFSDAQVRWMASPSKMGIVDFNQVLRGNQVGQPLAKAFARTEIEVPHDMDATIVYGAFFPGRIFVNGEQILNMTGPAFFNPDAIRRKVTLKAGRNELWVVSDENARSTVDNPISDGIFWGFTLAIQNAAGQPIQFTTR